ncbi:hypothetical protein C7974DRAFT_402874 [Boeremia exigua]|uniref:uncharacterized protein n=1 Tax=Boeremia exigua TaxID=749465 RepID=UPI001E8ED0EA|nr:uncharacterized protein C7974DRAFT_402874 [Boeremia exigua]KAH6614899.1 hypothetical protein C7974DRAFT_402874 [Boeremia exigua]
MTRVIQDSDDELDDELEVDVHHVEKDASSKHAISNASSTEALRRQIEAAHRAHLQSQLPVHEGRTQAIPDTNRRKRKLSSEFVTNSALNGSCGVQYGADSGPVDGFLGSLPTGQQHVQHFIGPTPQLAETPDGAEWLLEGTIREPCAQHNPRKSFPEPSSTVPNATLTQQRMMEGVLPPALLGSEVDSGRVPFEPNASIPWSEYLNSPPNATQHPRSSAGEPCVSQSILSGFETVQSHKRREIASPGPSLDEELSSPGMLGEQYKPRPSRSRSSKIGTQEAIDYSVRPEKAVRANRRERTTPAATSALNTPKRIRQICDMGFTPSTSARALRQNNGDVTQTVNWLVTNKVAEDELVDDTPPLPKLNIDHPARSSEMPKDDCEPQAGTSSAKYAVATDIGAMSAAMKDKTTCAEEVYMIPGVDLRSPSKVQVVIPAKSPGIIIEPHHHRAFEGRSISSDQHEPGATTSVIKGVKPGKKRSRGRPGKIVEAPASTIRTQMDEKECHGKQAEDLEPLLDKDVRPPSVQNQGKEGTANAATTKVGQESKGTRSGDVVVATFTRRSTPERAVLPDRPDVEPITPERMKKIAPREQPSSNRAKVTYRVGLSKRARIAPLLRVVRK